MAFITFEGGEGAGKSTQARLLADALAASGRPVLRTREPGGSAGAERLRALLLGGGTEWSPLAEAMLHFAARAEHVARTIRPAMEAGMDVVCDRFTDSTMAYQAYGQGADPEVIAGFARLMDFTPDLTLVLDVSEPVAKSRLAARGGAADRYEAEAASFHARVRAGFRAIAAADPARCVLIPADGHVTEVHAAVMAAVARVVP